MLFVDNRVKIRVWNAMKINSMSVSCKVDCSSARNAWKIFTQIYNNNITKEKKIMVAHIKSHRLVAFLIYSSLSIYASHGKNEYIIEMSSFVRDQIYLVLRCCCCCCCSREWRRSEKIKKSRFFGSCCFSLLLKECFSVLLFIELSLFEVFVYIPEL